MGVTEIESRIGDTVSVVELLTRPKLAVIVVLPTAVPLANPDEFTVATAGDVDRHVTAEVTSLVLPSP